MKVNSMRIRFWKDNPSELLVCKNLWKRSQNQRRHQGEWPSYSSLESIASAVAYVMQDDILLATITPRGMIPN